MNAMTVFLGMAWFGLYVALTIPAAIFIGRWIRFGMGGDES